VTAPSIEQHPTGFGIGVASPRLSWRFVSEDDVAQNWEQTGYEIEIVHPAAESESDAAEVYRLDSNASVLVPWPSRPLKSREQARVRVRVYGNVGPEPTDWSPWTLIECALLQREDWSARPITSAGSDDTNDPSGPLRPLRFRKTFVAPDEATVKTRSRLYITSLGVYRAFINGKPVGDHCMAPGWTSYNHRLNYQVFDIASLLKPGETNVIAVEVAEGWYAGRLGFGGGRRFIYGDKIAVLAQLEIGPHDATTGRYTLSSDESWSCHASAIIRSEIYDGELYEARGDNPAWTGHGEYDDHTWQPVRELPFPQAQLIAPDAPPVRVIEEIQPVDIITTPSGKTVIDFGQNLVGRLLVRSLHKPAGHKVTFTHAEVLENGELGTRPLRHAKCADTVISAGKKLENWSPQFTFHGFRYVQVDGWSPSDPEDPLLKDGSLCAQVLHTDMARTGHFSCSHPMVNKLHQNALWSMRGNFLSIPTDCPQRDERLGWTGDIQVFCPSASFLYNTAGMLGDWLKDMSAEQLAESHGIPPIVVPNVLQNLWPEMPQAVWHDVAVLTPWDLYRSYGDKDILRRQYPSMVAWLDRGIQRGPDRLWDPALLQLGDWLDPTAPPDDPGDARTDGTLVADAYLVRVTRVMAQISTILGHKEDAERYTKDADHLTTTFQAKYIAPSGLIVSDTQTALSLALFFNLHATTQQSSFAASRLATLVRKSRFRVKTGFAGTPLVTHALTQTGHHQLAYRMLLEKNRPSWMYPVLHGATTVWERWDSMLPDGSINPGEMTSFNHYALGSVVNWLHECVGGVSTIEAGWKTFKVAPVPGGTITAAEVRYETPYGRVECKWEVREGGWFGLWVVVPANCRALVVLPGERRVASGETEEEEAQGRWVGSGRHHLQSRWDILEGWPPEPLVPPMMPVDPDSIV
jgi:alpha-L-rhamnosidase